MTKIVHFAQLLCKDKFQLSANPGMQPYFAIRRWRRIPNIPTISRKTCNLFKSTLSGKTWLPVWTKIYTVPNGDKTISKITFSDKVEEKRGKGPTLGSAKEPDNRLSRTLLSDEEWRKQWAGRVCLYQVKTVSTIPTG